MYCATMNCYLKSSFFAGSNNFRGRFINYHRLHMHGILLFSSLILIIEDLLRCVDYNIRVFRELFDAYARFSCSDGHFRYVRHLRNSMQGILKKINLPLANRNRLGSKTDSD